MKILLLGEYSNVHATLAEGLRALGQDVVLASEGDNWKNYPRDIDLFRESNSTWCGIKTYLKIKTLMPQFENYDVVQIINPVFLPLKAERHYEFYHQLRRNNGKLFLGAFGMDYYWVKAGLDCKTFRYSDFNIGSQVRPREDNDIWIHDWLEGPKGELNRYIADDCDGIVAGLYEYYAGYKPYFPQKLTYIPFPIRKCAEAENPKTGEKIKFFIGIQRSRSSYKGTDIMLRALERVESKYPDACEIVRVENVPFEEYKRLMNDSDVILDQLYSYTPAMNALEAMARGLVVVGGGEPENYEILHENELRPIVNVEPNEESVFNQLCNLIEHRKDIPCMKKQSQLYIARHHDHIKVAQQYLDFWKSKALR